MKKCNYCFPKSILLFSLLLFSYSIFAQSYEKTLIPQKKWTVRHTTHHGGLSSFWDEFQVLNCDTVINSKHYYHLYNANNISSGLYGYLREDTINKKIYFMAPSSTTETLFIDYSLNVGDSIYYTGFDTPAYTKVVHIDTMFIAQKNRRVLHFEGYGSGNHYLKFVEGVGDYYRGLNMNSSSSVVAGYKYVSQVNSNTNITCDSIQSLTNVTNIEPISSTSEIKIKHYPIPVTQNLTIEVENPKKSLYQIEVYNLIGELLLEKKISPNDTLNLETLDAGLYILVLENSQTFKIVKQHQK
ncbi:MULTISPECIES: T9SS type A sorting domain-containing protein [unclassified Aureispira]|uniref:T9SS type A sorting domain-containing protein n=1 Tax=unclassified Aureispira TaxID=2649989 RepID=UPI0009E01C7D|nr:MULTISPECIES: T9SS type A sorting domain-containing protein [unclassified Aureispira]WMX12368.1 T9SS type A sorting domain-containing protein [Aureispira sp. CCB-E]